MPVTGSPFPNNAWCMQQLLSNVWKERRAGGKEANTGVPIWNCRKPFSNMHICTAQDQLAIIAAIRRQSFWFHGFSGLSQCSNCQCSLTFCFFYLFQLTDVKFLLSARHILLEEYVLLMEFILLEGMPSIERYTRMSRGLLLRVQINPQPM